MPGLAFPMDENQDQRVLAVSQLLPLATQIVPSLRFTVPESSGGAPLEGLLCSEWHSEMNHMEHKNRAGPLVAKPGALHIRILGSAPWPEKEGLEGMGLGLCVVLVIALWLD